MNLTKHLTPGIFTVHLHSD